MPDQDNIQMEKVALSQGDFSEDLGGNDFGIQDTQLVASNHLNKFLLTDPDDIKNLEEEKKAEELKKQQEAEKAKQQQQQTQETPEQKQAREAAEKKAKEEKPDGKKALEAVLYGENEEEGNEGGSGNEGRQPNGETGNPGNVANEQFTTLGRDLLRLGVFQKNSEDESEESIVFKTPEEFLDRFNLEKKKGAIGILDSFLSQFGEDYREMFDAVFVKGVKPQDYLQSFAKIEAMQALDLASEENQERVVRTYYKGLKWDDAKIEAKITKMKDYGDLEEEAKTYHEVLLNKEKEQAAAVAKQKETEAQETKNKDAATKKSYQRILLEKLKAQEFDGLPITQKDVDEALIYMSEKKFRLASGELLSEYDKDLLELNRPENHELKVKLGLLLRKKLDLKSIKKATISKKSDELFTLSTKNAKQQQNSKEKEMKSFF